MVEWLAMLGDDADDHGFESGYGQRATVKLALSTKLFPVGED